MKGICAGWLDKLFRRHTILLRRWRVNRRAVSHAGVRISAWAPATMPPKPSVNVARQTKHNWRDHKTTPKQPLSVQEGLKRLFTSLCAQIDGGHLSNAVKTCDKSVFHFAKMEATCLTFCWKLVLRLDPKDVDARQTKLFLLLQTEQCNAALSLIDSDDDQAHHAYERAYSLYRLSHESEASEVLKSIKGDQDTEDSRGLVHLEAQLACSVSQTQTKCSRSLISGLSPRIVWCRVWFVQSITWYCRTSE